MSSPRFPVAVVTGAASGIGRALAQQLAAEGSTVLASDINSRKLEAAAGAIGTAGGAIETAALDVTDEAAVTHYAQMVLKQHGVPDLLVNNAGIAMSGRIWQMTSADLDSILRVNYWGVVHGTLAFLPAMRERDQGRIVNICSIFGIASCPAMSAYCSSKFAVRGFTECLRMELDLDRSMVRVTAVHPGGIDTDILEVQRNASLRTAIPDHEAVKARFRKQAFTSSKSAARQILKAAAKGKRRALIGFDARILDLIQRLCPTLYQPLLIRILGKTARLL